MAGVIRLTPAAAMVLAVGDVWEVAGVADGESGSSLEWVGLSKFEKSVDGDGCGGM